MKIKFVVYIHNKDQVKCISFNSKSKAFTTYNRLKYYLDGLKGIYVSIQSEPVEVNL